MGKLNLADRLADPASPDGRPRRGAYALPTLFTAGNLFLGYIAILKSFEGIMLAKSGNLGPNFHLDHAAIAIGVAVFLDGLDGGIARLTNTVSDFGRELDSLADVITFGVAPAVLAFTWGFAFLDGPAAGASHEQLQQAGYFAAFLYLVSGAARLARFNIQKDPVPKNPGKPNRRYFVGLPIPGAAAVIAAIVYATGSIPIERWYFSAGWGVLLVILALLMVSTWRYRSFKDFNLLRPRSFRSVVLLGTFIYLIWNYSRPFLLALALTYVGSGIAVRIGGAVKSLFEKRSSRTASEEEASA